MRTIYRVSGRLHLKCLFKQTNQQSYESYEWKDNEGVKRESNKIKQQQQRQQQKKCNRAELFWCHLLSCIMNNVQLWNFSVLFCIDFGIDSRVKYLSMMIQSFPLSWNWISGKLNMYILNDAQWFSLLNTQTWCIHMNPLNNDIFFSSSSYAPTTDRDRQR